MNAMARLFAGVPARPLEVLPQIPTLRDVSPRYAEIEDRRTDLVLRMQGLEAERLRLARIVAEHRSAPGVAERDQRIATLAGVPLPALRPADMERLDAVSADLGEVKEAIRLVDIERNDAWLEASALLCDAVAERHSELQRDVFRAALDLHAAWSQHQAMLDGIRRTGAAFSRLRPELPDFLGRHPSNRADELAQWFRDLVKAGHATHDELPEAYR
jgi:hypothetical protein